MIRGRARSSAGQWEKAHKRVGELKDGKGGEGGGKTWTSGEKKERGGRGGGKRSSMTWPRQSLLVSCIQGCSAHWNGRPP